MGFAKKIVLVGFSMSFLCSSGYCDEKEIKELEDKKTLLCENVDSFIFSDEGFRTAKKGDTWDAWWNDWTWDEKFLSAFRGEPPDKYSEKEKDEMEINKLKTKNSELINENVALRKNQEELEKFVRDNPEKFDLSMSIDQLKQEINALKEEKSKINNNIEALKSNKQGYIDEENALRKRFSESKRDYELQQGELQAHKEKLEKAKLDLGAEYSAFEKDKSNYDELKKKFEEESLRRKKLLRLTWVDFLKTTASGNRLFSQMIAGATAAQLLAIEEAVYGSYLSTKENAVLMGKFFQWGSDWQNHPLKRAYTMIYEKGIQYQISGEEEFVSRRALFAIDVNGERELLAISDESFCSEELVEIFTLLKKRHLREIFLVAVPVSEDLRGALQKTFPDAEWFFNPFE